MKRLRVNLRVLLLLVAFCAVLFAWAGVKWAQRDNALALRIVDLRLMRAHALRMADRSATTAEQAMWKNSAAECDAMIAANERELKGYGWANAFAGD